MVSHCDLVPLTKQKRLQRLSETAVLQFRLSEVRRQIVPDSDPAALEGSVAEVSARPTDKKRSSLIQDNVIGVLHVFATFGCHWLPQPHRV